MCDGFLFERTKMSQKKKIKLKERRLKKFQKIKGKIKNWK